MLGRICAFHIWGDGAHRKVALRPDSVLRFVQREKRVEKRNGLVVSPYFNESFEAEMVSVVFGDN